MIDTSFKGLRGAKALHIAYTVMRSIYYMPVYVPKDKDRDFLGFMDWLETLSGADLYRYIKLAVYEGAMLENSEMLILIEFATDKNGVAYSRENVDNLNPCEVLNTITDVVFELLKKK